MLLIIILIFSIPLNAIENPNEQHDKLMNFTTSVILNSFARRQCLYLIGNRTGHIRTTLSISLRQTMLPFLMTTRNFSTISSVCIASGYLIYSDSFEEIEDIFKQHFLPHKRILIFFAGIGKFHEYPFARSYKVHGNDIIVVENYGNSAEIITVSYLNGNFTIINWVVGTDFVLDKNKFKHLDWEPNFSNSKFRVSLFHCPPYLKFSKSKGIYGGIEKYIFEELTKGWPIEYLVYGKFSWGSVLKDIAQNKSDLAMCAHYHFRIIRKKLDVVRYMETCATYLVPKPKLIRTSIFAPFSAIVWILSATVIVTIAAIIHIFDKNFGENFLYSFIEIYRLSVVNPMIRFPIGKPLAFLMVIYYIACLQLNTGYSAGLAKSLTTDRYTPPINTFEDILKYNIHCYDVGIDTADVLKESTDSWISAVGSTIEIRKTIEELPLDSCYAANVIDDYVIPIDGRIRTRLKILSECYGNFYLSLGLSHESAFTKKFTEKANHFNEHGLIIAWFKFTTYENYKDLRKMSKYFTIGLYSGNRSLSTLQLTEVFFILIGGYFISIIVFIMELNY